MDQEIKMMQNLEIFDMIEFINQKKRLHQKLALNGIEEILDKNSPEYKAIRKLVLDNSNEFARSIVRSIFGETFEGVIK
jgi:hypothetical protein